MLREHREHERAEARARMILDRETLDDLLDHVEAALEDEPCDHSLRHTRSWALAHAVDVDRLKASLEHFGGYCDCEVTLNLDPEEIFGVQRTGSSSRSS